jgi:predicted dehydrogenase
VCDANQEILRKIESRYARELHFVNFTSKIEDLLEDPELDAVCIATPASTHYAIAKSSLKAGKHVLIEKPLTLHSKEGEELVAMAENRRLKLMVGHTFQFNNAVKKLKEYLELGEIGRLYYLYFSRTGLGPIRQDVNALWDLAPHDISVLLYLLGKHPTQVHATGASFIQPGVHDVVFATLKFADGILDHIHVSWLDPHKIRKITLIGSEKMVVFDDVEPLEKVRIYTKGATRTEPPSSFGEFQISLRMGDVVVPYIPLEEPLKQQCKHFVDCVLLDKQPQSDGRNGVEVVRVLEKIQESLDTSEGGE